MPLNTEVDYNNVVIKGTVELGVKGERGLQGFKGDQGPPVPVAHELGDDPDLAVSQKLLTDSIADMELSNEAAVTEAAHQAGLAEAARDAAFVNADVYPDVAAGLAAVADGDQFQVLSDEGLEYRRYRKDSATVATEVGEGFPTPKQVEGAVQQAENAADRAESAASSVEQNAEQIAQDAAQQAASAVIAGVDGQVDVAQGAADRAEAARDAAFVNADIYPDVATGLAAVADGEQFQVVEGDEIVRYRRDSASAQTEMARYPSAATVSSTQLKATETALAHSLLSSGRERPKAAVVLLLGQSLNAPRGVAEELVGAPTAKMAYGGASIYEWQFTATNILWSSNWEDLSAAVDFTEGTGQTPSVGIVNALAGGRHSRIYICSAAIGARSLEVLLKGEPISNVSAALYRFCEIARADGYDPEVMFYTAHGEANAHTSTTPEAYLDLGLLYYGKMQLYAAQAMRKPGYMAPIVFTYPNQTSAGDNGQRDADVKEGIRLIVDNLPNAIGLGPIYQWPMGSDRVHPEPASFVMRGEAVGKALKDYTTAGVVYQQLRITDVALNGTEFVATFSEPVVRDDTTPFGSALNASNAKDGFEWFDNGTNIGVTALVYEGWKVRGTLASAPSGTLAQQDLRIASQATPALTAAGPTVNAGSVVRAQSAGWPSIFTPSYINYKWASPQSYTNVRQG